MQLSMARARIVFRPRLWATLLAATLVPVFVSLGQWQLAKAHAKESAQALLDERGRGATVALPREPVTDLEALHLRPVSVRGEYDAAGQILIDNQVLRERAGYHVLTPLRMEGSSMRVLVNRGWIPAPAERGQPPRVEVAAGLVTVSGIAVRPSRKFFQLAADTAPAGAGAVWQNLDLDRYRSLSAHPVQPLVVQMAPESEGGGFVREWPRLDARHERHLSYAYQWFGFAGATVALWLYYAFRQHAP